MLALVALLAAVASAHNMATLKLAFSRAPFASPAALALALPAEARPGAALIFRRLDSNGDGQVTLDEIAQRFPRTLARENALLKQGHLSFGGAGSAWIMWVTDDLHAGAFVRWGPSPSSLPYSSNGTTHTYDVGLGGYHKHIYQAQMTALAVNTTVYYQFGHVGVEQSSVLSFRTPRTSEASIAFLGDQGTVEPAGTLVAQQIARDAARERIDAVHIAGDLAYAWDAFPPGPEEEWIWDLYQQEQEVYALGMPQMAGAGNHEQFANATAFANRYRFPGPESGGDANFYYSYNVGPVHVTVFTTDGPPSKTGPQMTWLLKDLASVNRAVTPWVVFTTHRPVYCSDKEEFDQHAAEQALFEPAFLQYGVDLVVVGHMHVYERIYPTKGGVPVVPAGSHVYTRPGAPAYVVQGTGGSFLSRSNTWMEPQPAWSAFRSVRHYGYALLTANATHLDYQFRALENDSSFDQFTILK